MAAAAASLVQVSQMDAEVGQQVLRLHQHVEQMADRRALIAADVGDARLQQRLGHGQDALAVERLAGAQAQALDLLVERNFSHRSAPNPFRAPTCPTAKATPSAARTGHGGRHPQHAVGFQLVPATAAQVRSLAMRKHNSRLCGETPLAGAKWGRTERQGWDGLANVLPPRARYAGWHLGRGRRLLHDQTPPESMDAAPLACVAIRREQLSGRQRRLPHRARPDR